MFSCNYSGLLYQFRISYLLREQMALRNHHQSSSHSPNIFQKRCLFSPINSPVRFFWDNTDCSTHPKIICDILSDFLVYPKKLVHPAHGSMTTNRFALHNTDTGKSSKLISKLKTQNPHGTLDMCHCNRHAHLSGNHSVLYFRLAFFMISSDRKGHHRPARCNISCLQ